MKATVFRDIPGLSIQLEKNMVRKVQEINDICLHKCFMNSMIIRSILRTIIYQDLYYEDQIS